MTTHTPSITVLTDHPDSVQRPAGTLAGTAAAKRAADLAALNAREDAFLRAGNGIRDAVVFPRLRAMGIAEAGLHRTAMAMVRQVQYTRNFNGATAKLLGVVRCGINGTTAAPEVD